MFFAFILQYSLLFVRFISARQRMLSARNSDRPSVSPSVSLSVHYTGGSVANG